jgi:hypothetical protein
MLRDCGSGAAGASAIPAMWHRLDSEKNIRCLTHTQAVKHTQAGDAQWACMGDGNGRGWADGIPTGSTCPMHARTWVPLPLRAEPSLAPALSGRFTAGNRS